ADYDVRLLSSRSHLRFKIRSLSGRFALSSTERRTLLRNSVDDQQPSGRGAPRGFLRHSVSCHSGDKGEQAGGGEETDRLASKKQYRTDCSCPVYASAFEGLHRAIFAANHQYPSFVSAGVCWREAAPAGFRSRGETDWGNGALRYGSAG